MSIMGLDVGTTGVKAIAFDECGRIAAHAYREYPLLHPQPGWAELHADALWANVKDAIGQVNAELSDDPVEALSISSQGEAVVPIDKAGDALSPFIVAFDNRTIPQCNWWRDNIGAEFVFGITGMPLHPMYTINKCMWYAKNRPDVHRRVWKYLCVQDFMIYRLCGQAMIDHSMAARTMAFDVKAKCWSGVMFAKAELATTFFSLACPAGTIAGDVRPALARELGFLSKVKVVTGGHDQACGALGAGVIREGMAMNSTGTVDVLCAAFEHCNLDPSMLRNNYCCYPHVYPEMYISVGFNFTGGQLLKWFRDVICTDEVRQAQVQGIDPYGLIIDKASVEPADVFILPHFVGAGTPTLDPESKGAIVGLTMETDKSDLTRAILDSLNYEMKVNLDRMAASGIAIDELRTTGGGAKSDKWLQMKADVFGKTIVALAVSEAAALGAALLAGTAVGRYASLDEAVETTVRTKKQYHPDWQEHERYRPRYEQYCRIYPSLREMRQ